MTLDEGLDNLCLMRCQLRWWGGALASSLTQNLLEVYRQYTLRDSCDVQGIA